MMRVIIGFLLSASFCLLLCGCSIPTRGFNPPPTAEEWYQKPGADRDQVGNDLKQCGYNRFDPATSNYVYMNNSIKVDYCMADKGYVTQDRKTPADVCKNWRELQLPICIARGGYNN